MPEGRRPLIAALLIGSAVALASATGALFTPGAWYASLNQPLGTPPDLAFPIAWTLLYVFMAVAGWRVWMRAGSRAAMALFGIQLALNAAWMPVAFGLQWLAGALAVILALTAALIATLVVFWRIDRIAGGLFVPYLAWVAYAVYLTAGLVWLN